ncbi:MAG: hypothetical protein COU81_00235 [Candidatus Portnoybacteria bacterium CG10_big_fil_rev_8_21_14_0_10_36_7]|uniref:FAD/NAD(P)-binding domain-containing protein n=1 Tax=Candidatus Portnoybacteria bacterium CG10_big_fil_rev_8_21_14_0_10_36_7 TaxID=1974812 RepID=A0A2M8KF23_9BACT|nr:MAG: hypothetical protein COU81_00235 [Candidatus Portnoybacteria bacterium CG10_big_fil_rev_8_21_14_0_10_36_7]
MYDLIIIGGGVAGISSGIYAGRKKLKTLLIYKKLGGQSASTSEIQNWPGIKSILGLDFSQNLYEHLNQYDVELKENDEVSEIEKKETFFIVKTTSEESLECKTIIIAAGKTPRKLKVQNSDKFEGKGIAYCSICDAPLYTGKEVAVVGGGNSGLEAVLDLQKYATKVHLLESTGKLNGDSVLIDKIKNYTKVEFHLNTEIIKLDGTNWLENLTYAEKSNGKIENTINVQGIFVEIGYEPATDFVKKLVKLNQRNEITVNAMTGATSEDGIFAAGDITDNLYKQIVIAAGEGAKAALSAEKYINHN